MSEENHEVRLTIVHSSGVVKAAADPDPAKIVVGDSVRWNVTFEEHGNTSPRPDGPAVEIRFTNRQSGPFAALFKDSATTTTGWAAERKGSFNYHVFLEGQHEPLAWRSKRNFGGVDVGDPPRGL